MKRHADYVSAGRRQEDFLRAVLDGNGDSDNETRSVYKSDGRFRKRAVFTTAFLSSAIILLFMGHLPVNAPTMH
jgi:hypothetical protein